MKKISLFQFAIAFCGSFLGAGFVSGQELLQFFGVFGYYGVLGLALSGAAFYFFGKMAALVAFGTGITDYDKVVIRGERPVLRAVFTGLTVFFLFGSMVVMIAGAGALTKDMAGIPIWVGSGMMCILLILVSAAGASGVLAAFNVLVPFMIFAGVAVGICSVALFPGDPVRSNPVSGSNIFIGNWVSAAASFLSYNLLASTAVMLPLSKLAESERSVKRGVLLGTVLLILIALSILIPVMRALPLVSDAALPMLVLAKRIHPAFRYLYAGLLFCGMFGAALSCVFAVVSRIGKVGALSGMPLIGGMVFLAFFCSMFGFKNLVTFFYPVCGYAGIFALVGVFLHFRAFRQKKGA